MKQEFYKKIYSHRELYRAVILGMQTLRRMKRSRKTNELDAHFFERIMLAVTEVNGCEVCSYAHTKMALETGMQEDEIRAVLIGDIADTPADQITAIIFAQHYADSRGYPKQDAWCKVIEQYGEPLALGILGAIRMIMIGNIYGIAFSAFRSRLKGKAVNKSSLSYELSMLIGLLFYLPVAIIHTIINVLMGRPLICFETNRRSAVVNSN